MAKELQSPGSFLALMLEKYKLNPFKLSKDIHLSQSAVRLITIGKTKITTPVAMRLAKYFNTNPEFWLAMQMKWDIVEASKDKALVKIIKSISRVTKASAGGGDKKPVPAKKPAAKKPAAKKKATAKKATAKKATRKRVTAKKPRLVKKPRLLKKTAAKRKVAKKTAAKRTAARKPAAAKRKPAVRKSASKRKTTRKTTARKPVAARKPVKAKRKPAATRTKVRAKAGSKARRTAGKRGRPAKK